MEFGVDLCSDCIDKEMRSGCDKCLKSAIKDVGKKCGHCKLSICTICRKCCNPIDKIMGH